jgi:hypothetical protein
LQSVEHAEPSPLVPARALARAAELGEQPAQRRARKALTLVAVAAAAFLVLAVLALAAHSRSSAPAPAKPPHPTKFSGLPPVGAAPSTPANDGRQILNISPASGGSWNIYTDGRIVITGHSQLLPTGANPFHVDDVQQWLTPQGVQLLRSRILAIGRPVGLFRHNLVGNNALGDNKIKGQDWYQIFVGGRSINTSIDPPSIFNSPPKMVTPAQVRAVNKVDQLVANAATQLPASAWKDSTLRPYIPTHYCAAYDRGPPDPAKLPSPARELLAQQQRILRHASGTLTTDQARALFAAFAAAHLKLVSNQPGEIDWNIRTAAKRGAPENGLAPPSYTVLRFSPGLPDGGC